MSLFRQNYLVIVNYDNGYRRWHFIMARSAFDANRIALKAFTKAISASAEVAK